MALTGDHAENDSGHTTDHNLIDDAIVALQSLVPSPPLLKETATAKGDIYIATGPGTLVRLGTVAKGNLLVENPAETTGRKSLSPLEMSITTAPPFRAQVGEYITSLSTSTGTSAGYTQGTLYFERVDFAYDDLPFVADRIETNITAVGTGSGQVVRMGWYADNGTGTRPTGAPLFDAGTVATLSGTGAKSITINQSISVPHIWLAWVLQGTVTTSPTVVIQNLVNLTGLADTGNNSHRCWAQSGATGALPSVGTLFRTNNPPMIALRRA